MSDERERELQMAEHRVTVHAQVWSALLLSTWAMCGSHQMPEIAPELTGRR